MARPLVSFLRPCSLFPLFVLGGLLLSGAAFGESVRMAAAIPERPAPDGAAGPSRPSISINADRLEYLKSEERYLADGHVVLEYGSLRLTADHLVYDDRSGEMEASGHVVLTEGTQQITMERLQFNLRTLSGVMQQADLVITEPPYRLTARRIERRPDGAFHAESAAFTTCDVACELGVPSWQFRARRLRVRLEEYLVASGVSLRIKGVPVAYLPWLIYPVKQERQSGLLIPKFGFNSTEGFQYEQPIYLALGRSHDATLSLDLRSRLGIGAKMEYRYRLTETGRGLLDAHEFHNWNTGDDFLAYHAEHEQAWGKRLALRWDVNLVNRRDFFTELSDSVLDRSRLGLESAASLVYRHDAQLAYLLAQFTQNLAGSSELVAQRLPEAGYRLADYRVGRLPLYAGLDATAVHFYRGEGLRLDDEGGERALRIDLFPALKARWEPVAGVTVTPLAGVRETFYRSRALVDDGSVAREIVYLALRADAQLIRRYATAVHLIEPALLYEYAHQLDQAVVPQFDEIDAAPEKRQVTMIVATRLRGADPSADDWLWIKATDSYRLRRSEAEPFSNVRLQAETRPLPDLTLAAESFVDLYGRGVVVMNSEARAKPKAWLALAVGQRYTRRGVVPQRGDLFSPETSILDDPIGGRERIAALRWGGQVELPWRVTLATKSLLDLQHRQFTEMSYGVRWRGACNECWAVTLVYQQFPEKHQVSFLITLRGVSGSESKGVAELFLE
ncbi:MAG: LPS assembly protein LptD [Nitrospirota bacterium]